MRNRSEPRKEYSGHIFFATQSGLYEGRLINYSRHGLFIATSISLPIGEIITLALPYMEGNSDKCKGQIIWHNNVGFGIELFRNRNRIAQNYFKSKVRLNKQNARISVRQWNFLFQIKMALRYLNSYWS